MFLGLDIGGANLKGAASDGRAVAAPFPLWKQPGRLTEALRQFCLPFSDFQAIGVTMTGELADCFATKAEGVARILSAVEEFAASRPVAVWSADGAFLDPQTAREQWRSVAAANWHALATWAGRFTPRCPALLIDIGSTTTDIIPLDDGTPHSVGRTDFDRLRHGELVYTGYRRTPLCAVPREVDVRGTRCPVAAEFFATTLDAHLILGAIPEDLDDRDTADGRPATIDCAQSRLARMLCADRTEITADELRSAAQQFAAEQVHQIAAALRQVISRLPGRPATVLISGSGAPLAHQALDAAGLATPRIDLGRQLSPEVSAAACAFAVSVLMADRGRIG
jgi:probable H4MPT-linked C1 transfer pathway protein